MTYYAARNGIQAMIQSFKCKETQALFEGGHTRRFRAIQSVAERKLAQLAAAQTLEFLRSPPGNRLEVLKGARAGQHSIRINDQWGACVLSGRTAAPPRSRLSITTEGSSGNNVWRGLKPAEEAS